MGAIYEPGLWERRCLRMEDLYIELDQEVEAFLGSMMASGILTSDAPGALFDGILRLTKRSHAITERVAGLVDQLATEEKARNERGKR